MRQLGVGDASAKGGGDSIWVTLELPHRSPRQRLTAIAGRGCESAKMLAQRTPSLVLSAGDQTANLFE